MKEEEEEEMVMEEEELINCSYCFQSYHKTKEMEHQKNLPQSYHKTKEMEHQKNLPLTYYTMPMWCCCGVPLIHSDGKLCASWRRTIVPRSRTRMQAVDREAVNER